MNESVESRTERMIEPGNAAATTNLSTDPGNALDPPLSQDLADLAGWEQDILPAPHECTSNARANFMFRVAVASLMIIGLMAGHGISGDANKVMFGWWLGIPLMALWLIIILEGLLGMATTHDHHLASFKRFLLVVLCPPFRAAFSPAYPNRFIWLPKHDWVSVGKLNYERAELGMAIPMLAVTLLVLPLLGIELFLASWLEQHLWAAVIVHALTAFVWFAFALEFIIMLALSEKKLVYCKLHWVNIAIIVLPLIAFLRIIRIFRFFRLGKASKLIRAYRMRGVVARTMRLAMVFNLIDRLLERNPEKYLLSLEEKVSEKKAEIEALEEKMEEVRQRMAEKKELEKAAAEAPGNQDGQPA